MFKVFKRLYCGIVGHKEFLYPDVPQNTNVQTSGLRLGGGSILTINSQPFKTSAKFCIRCRGLYWITTYGIQNLGDIAEIPHLRVLVEEHEHDAALRAKYPPLQKQWDSYQMHKKLLKP